MGGKIYLIDKSESLHDMSEQPYENVDLLQTLLERCPDVLAVELINQEAHWLLSKGESTV